MFSRVRYIEWAMRLYGRVSYDLAASGVPRVPTSEIAAGVPPGADDFETYPRFVEAIAQYNDRPAAEVVPALGTAHAAFLAYAAMLSPGDEVLVERPGYEPLVRCAEGLGAVVRTFDRREDRGFAIDPADVAARIGPRTRAIVVSTLHNPTGVRTDDATLRELAAIAEARGAWLLVDEVYAPFDDLPESGVFARSARRLAPNVVAIGSLTKCYGLGMHRLGWVLGPPEIAAHAHDAVVATAGHLPAPHAAFGVAAFASLGKLAARAKASLGDKRAIADAWVRSMPGVRWSAPREGVFGLVTLPGDGDLLPRIEHLAETKGVLVAAGTFFDMPRSFRLSWASCDAERFAEGLARLETLVRES